MGYVEQTLTDGEEILGRSRDHWSMWLLSIALLLAYVFFLCQREDIPLYYEMGGGILSFDITSMLYWQIFVSNGQEFVTLVGGLVSLIRNFIVQKTSEYVATTRRVVMKTGFIKRSSIELQYQKMEAVMLDQGIVARLWGSGDITISGTGGLRQKFTRLASPFEFRQIIDDQLSKIGDIEDDKTSDK